MKNATNKAVLKALGITQPNIAALQINMRPNELPLVTMACVIDAGAMPHEVLQFDMVLREEATPRAAPAFDLDSLCAQARTRLAGEVQHSASMAQAAHHKESAAIRSRMATAISYHRAATANALLRIEISSMVAQMRRALPGMGIGGFLGADFNTKAFGGLK